MNTRRVWLVYSLLAVISICSGAAIIRDAEYWPFSPYAMYSRMYPERSLALLWAFGVTKEDPVRELPLLAPEYLAPFDKQRLDRSFSRLLRQPPQLRAALDNVLKRYENSRLLKRHDGPPLQGIRLYKVSWRLDGHRLEVEPPHHKELLAEVTTGDRSQE